MKSFWIGVMSSFFVSMLMVVLGVYFAKPVFLFQTDETGSEIFLGIKNIGFLPADRVKLKLVLANAVKDEPVVRKQYWTHTAKINGYFSQAQVPASYRVQFDDKGELGEFSSGEEFRLLLMPKTPNHLNTVKARDLNLAMSVEGMVIEVDDMDIMVQAIPFAAVILVLVSLAYLALGYQWAKHKNKNIFS